jgi:hypothetical protein
VPPVRRDYFVDMSEFPGSANLQQEIEVKRELERRIKTSYSLIRCPPEQHCGLRHELWAN